jgi:hypothetical protein
MITSFSSPCPGHFYPFGIYASSAGRLYTYIHPTIGHTSCSSISTYLSFLVNTILSIPFDRSQILSTVSRLTRIWWHCFLVLQAIKRDGCLAKLAWPGSRSRDEAVTYAYFNSPFLCSRCPLPVKIPSTSPSSLSRLSDTRVRLYTHRSSDNTLTDLLIDLQRWSRT